MSDTTQHDDTQATAPEAQADERPAASDTTLPAVSGPANVSEGEEPREPTIEVVKDQVDALVVQPREPDSDKVNVHEVSVQLDERVYDRAIVPPEGRGSLDLPIHALDSPTVEQQFDAARKNDE